MPNREIMIELRYVYTINVPTKDDDDLEDAKEYAFFKACAEHAENTKHEKGDYNLSDTWMAYDAETQEAI